MDRRGVRAGRRNATGNRVGGLYPPRGFESLPLRHVLLYDPEIRGFEPEHAADRLGRMSATLWSATGGRGGREGVGVIARA